MEVESYLIDSALHNNKQEIASAVYKMLQEWLLNKEDRGIAWKELAVALEKCKLKLLIADILKK